jgi:hypothetical protein
MYKFAAKQAQKTPIFDLFRVLLLLFADLQASFFIVLRTRKASFSRIGMESGCLPSCTSTNMYACRSPFQLPPVL